jgi:MoxR-like ATPase
VAWELGFGEPLKFETKSTSSARDMFYVYDALGRYHQDRATTRALDYMTFSALGIAILRTCDRAVSGRYLPPDLVPAKPTRSLVLIDEIDKAPRDFPNDVLSELEGMYFRIPELDNVRIDADRDSPPVIIITSNSEKHLPDAFLRRCTYYHIPFPDRKRMKEIVSGRLSGDVDLDEPFLGDALDLFYELRQNRSQIRKKPSTAELLGWLMTLRRLQPEGGNPIRDLEPARVVSTIATLVKNGEDTESATITIRRWLAGGRNDGGADADG